MQIEECTLASLDDWADLRFALWPKSGLAHLRGEAEAMLASGKPIIAVLARVDDGEAVGFAEAGLRHDHVNGCQTSPVAFLEGIYVVPAWRRQGVARRLCAAVEDWSIRQGCSELGSDANLANEVSHQLHQALGFQETQRVVFFRKLLNE